MKEINRKIKLGICLLIVVAFILPSGSAIAGCPSCGEGGQSKAGITGTTDSAYRLITGDGSGALPLDDTGCWPVAVTSISLDGKNITGTSTSPTPIQKGEYAVDTWVSKTAWCYDTCTVWHTFMTDIFQESQAVGSILFPLVVDVKCDLTYVWIRFTNNGHDQSGYYTLGDIIIWPSFDNGASWRTYTAPFANPTQLLYLGNPIPGATVTRTGDGLVLPSVVEIKIPRATYWSGCCNIPPLKWDYQVFWASNPADFNNNPNFTPLADPCACDIYPATVKKFVEIYKYWKEPDKNFTLFCEDIEDACEIYQKFATVDDVVDTNGAIDTWTWTAKRSHSASHSFHNTAFDTYMPNQRDELIFNNGTGGMNIAGYDWINVTFWHWMQGDAYALPTNPVTYSLQDYGYVQYSYDGTTWYNVGQAYWNNQTWTQVKLHIHTNGNTKLYLRWVFISDPVFCYEGWYIDDICFTAHKGYTTGYTLVWDSHSWPQVITGQKERYVFPLNWTATPGTYKICVWLEAIDDCHFAVNQNDPNGQYPPFCRYVNVGDTVDIEFWDCVEPYAQFSPASPAWEGDNVNATYMICNEGTVNLTNVQVKFTVQRATKEVLFEDSFDRKNDVKNFTAAGKFRYSDFWQRAQSVAKRSYFHITNNASFPLAGSGALVNWNESDNCGVPNPKRFAPSLTQMGSGPYSNTEYIFTPTNASGQPLNLLAYRKDQVTMSFWANYKLPLGGWNQAGGRDNDVQVVGSIIDTSYGGGYGYYGDVSTWGYSYPIGFGFGGGDSNGWFYVDGLRIDSLLGSMVSGGISGATDTDVSARLLINKYATTNYYLPTDAWSGIMIDDFKLERLKVDPTPVYEQIVVIPSLNGSWWRECTWINFTWPNAGAGQYQITAEILTPHENTAYEFCKHIYNVINYQECPKITTCVDHTGPGVGHWVEEACCGGYLWAGDALKTTYGNNWSDALTLAPHGKALYENITGATTLEFDTWYQMKANDFGIVQYSIDGGLVWNNLATYGGNSFNADRNKFNWTHNVIPIAAFSNKMMFRFVFQSNATGFARGWLLDNIVLKEGATIRFRTDPCEVFDNFLRHEVQSGCWWRTPDQYLTQVNYGYGCYDPNYLPNPEVGKYPDNLNCSLMYAINTDQVFYGYLGDGTVGKVIRDLGVGDTGYLEISGDAGATWQKLQIFSGTGIMKGPWVVTPYCTGDTLLRWRMKSDASNAIVYNGLAFEDICFYGMKDKQAPTTTAQMTGTYNEAFAYYTSAVKIKLTASDDISGVDKIYYKLDGVQHEYTQLVTISTDGEHTFCYWSVDKEGNVETEKCLAPFRIDMTGPTVSITGPATGYLYLFGNQLMALKSGKTIILFGGIPVTATASSSGAVIKSVQFFLDDVLLAEDTTSPYAALLTTKHTGPAVIKVTAVDILGASASATLNIDNYMKLF